MAVKARDQVTVTDLTDIDHITTYYQLSTSATKPAKPTVATPASPWQTTEPGYTEGSTLYLYTCIGSYFKDGSFEYGEVSLSASFEAAKLAYNRAVSALSTANAAQATADAAGRPNLIAGFSASPVEAGGALSFKEGNGNVMCTFTQLEDGWVHVKLVNTATAVRRCDFGLPASSSVEPGADYTVLFEFRNNSSTGSNTMYVVQNGTASCQFWGGHIKKNLEGKGSSSSANVYNDFPPGTEGVYAKRFVKISETPESTHLVNDKGRPTSLPLVVDASAGVTAEYDFRVSLYDGEYTGPYKPYVDQSLGELKTLVRPYEDGVLVCKTGNSVGALVNADGSFDVTEVAWSYGTPTAGASIASFGESARIGRSDRAHLDMDYRSLAMVSSDGAESMRFQDLRDASGFAHMTEYFVGDGSNYHFIVRTPVYELGSVTVDSVEQDGVTASTYWPVDGNTNPGLLFELPSPPGLGAVVAISYTTQAPSMAATLGTRRDGSQVGGLSLAEGWDTEASGRASHAEGYRTAATGFAAHAAGWATDAKGDASFAGGRGTVAASSGQYVLGEYNEEDPSGKYLLIIGRGMDNLNRANVLTVDRFGNIECGTVNGVDVTSLGGGGGGGVSESRVHSLIEQDMTDVDYLYDVFVPVWAMSSAEIDAICV